eukprot:757253-Hanusia_phi.AAC.4
MSVRPRSSRRGAPRRRRPGARTVTTQSPVPLTSFRASEPQEFTTRLTVVRLANLASRSGPRTARPRARYGRVPGSRFIMPLPVAVTTVQPGRGVIGLAHEFCLSSYHSMDRFEDFQH